MKVLVTGAGGFIGRNLVSFLQEKAFEVYPLSTKECDLRTSSDIPVLKNLTFDFIFHLAAVTRAGSFCDINPGLQWIDNQLINTNVLHFWLKHQPQAKLIAMGTSVSYAPGFELKEENYMLGEPIDRFFSYAMSKRMLYAGLKALHKQYRLQYLYLVPSTVYGPSYHTDKRELHFIYDIIRKIISGKESHDPVTLFGDGNQKRELIYISDFIEILFALSMQISNTIINIGAGEEYSIIDFARKICDDTGFDFNQITFDRSKDPGVKSKILNIDRLHSYLPDPHKTSLNKGLKETIAWVRNNMDNI